MLYVYFGEDNTTARAKVQATIGSLVAKNPDALYFRITPESLRDYSLEELTESQALFKNEYIVLLDSLLTSEQQQTVLDHLEQIATSPHAFFVLDGKILAPVRKKLEKHAKKIEEFKNTTTKEKEHFNAFLMTDALGARDKKKLWSLFREGKLYGASDEELHGILFWMYKSMLLAHSARTPDEAGMKPYPFTKAKRYSENFESGHLVAQTQALAALPQYARRQGIPLEIALERFLLRL